MNERQNKRVLVTGAGTGIGSGTALALERPWRCITHTARRVPRPSSKRSPHLAVRWQPSKPISAKWYPCCSWPVRQWLFWWAECAGKKRQHHHEPALRKEHGSTILPVIQCQCARTYFSHPGASARVSEKPRGFINLSSIHAYEGYANTQSMPEDAARSSHFRSSSPLNWRRAVCASTGITILTG